MKTRKKSVGKVESEKVTTLMVYESFTESAEFYLLEGDYRHLDGVYINSSDCDEKKADELTALLYDPDSGAFLLKNRLKEPTRDHTHFIQCGFLP